MEVVDDTAVECMSLGYQDPKVGKLCFSMMEEKK